MNRRLLLVLTLSFLLASAVFAPIAFSLGKSRGDSSSIGLLQNETSFNGAAGLTGDHAGCGLLGNPSSIHYRNAVIECRETGVDKARQILASPAKAKRKVRTIFDSPIQKRESTPLDRAVLASVTGRGAAAGGAPTDPLSLAMVPGAGPSGSIFENFGGGGGGVGGGSGVLPGIGLPQNLIPPSGGQAPGDAPDGGPVLAASGPTNMPTSRNATPDSTPSGPGPDAGETPMPPIFEIPDDNDPYGDPDLVTPVPAALPLMITGLAGLFAARRRKANK